MTEISDCVWKTATASSRPASQLGEKNIHIGQTLRDLYFEDEAPSTNDTFSTLLGKLRDAESDSEQR